MDEPAETDLKLNTKLSYLAATPTQCDRLIPTARRSQDSRILKPNGKSRRLMINKIYLRMDGWIGRLDRIYVRPAGEVPCGRRPSRQETEGGGEGSGMAVGGGGDGGGGGGGVVLGGGRGAEEIDIGRGAVTWSKRRCWWPTPRSDEIKIRALPRDPRADHPTWPPGPARRPTCLGQLGLPGPMPC